MPPGARLVPVPTSPGDTLEPDADTDKPLTPRDVYEALVRMETRLLVVEGFGTRLDRIEDHVGPQAAKHQRRREAGLLCAAVAGVGCLGIGALSLQGADTATVLAVTFLVALGVAAVATVFGDANITAKLPGGAEVGASRDRTDSTGSSS